ncbi:RNA polymerase II C-terminal domain phosphatase-like 4 [Telopea speciosissima]|uniref:RNA polymerase II C-terminal domain phosphatase-like 4 n=1 Tax=Telopea speciosissima TaxID=54955 RepID=UPI001CC3759F|nr:RNA polymerase II C-terminal domain phosphatase-like 4 [Telopea speciosissima]XP_043702342.1 RNA polymerase II C-terminal domain phosphatase-like 4 [Telopea speciosissima]
MSLTADSPVHSSSSDDFAALLDAELETTSTHSSPDLEDNENESDLETERIKKRKMDEFEILEKSRGTTSHGDREQGLDASINEEICPPHPGFIRGMCIRCGQLEEDESAVAFGYVHKDLRLGTEEIARLRGVDLKKLLRDKKLYLVLDLDHTLLNSTRLVDLNSKEEYLKDHTDSLQDVSNGSVFRLDSIHMLTKLRPFVHTFLKEASSMFEMYVYTMGERSYALEMAKLLDPGRVYFSSRVISQADCTQRHQKGLDVVLGAESAVVILDDTEQVWQKHKENLILMERYHFFSSSNRQFGINTESLSELKRDECESEGALATVLKVLKRIHEMFFDPELDANLAGRDVRQVLKMTRQEVLMGCKIVFSRVFPKFEAENNHFWKMAERLGAICCTEIDPSVTHVVSADTETEKARWAVEHKKFLVNPQWLEATNYLWKRQPEENFTIKHIKNQWHRRPQAVSH